MTTTPIIGQSNSIRPATNIVKGTANIGKNKIGSEYLLSMRVSFRFKAYCLTVALELDKIKKQSSIGANPRVRRLLWLPLRTQVLQFC